MLTSTSVMNLCYGVFERGSFLRNHQYAIPS